MLLVITERKSHWHHSEGSKQAPFSGTEVPIKGVMETSGLSGVQQRDYCIEQKIQPQL